MQLENRFLDFIHSQSLFQATDKLLVAVSGGVDSMALCELCFLERFSFIVAHCNFQLRGSESDRDEEFVRTIRKKYSTEVLTKRFPTQQYAEEKKVSIQVAARELRYTWFNELIEQGYAKWIITAHHLDDNIETVLMNFFKGTGISGMRGMLPKTERIVRPLLFARKEELVEFAIENKLQWVEDSSNETDKYSRNYLRHQVVPSIEKIYPTVIANLSGNIERFREIEKFHKAAIEDQLRKLLEIKGEEVQIPILKLKKMQSAKTILFELITRYGFSPVRTDEVIQLMESETGKYLLSTTHRILKNRNWLIISPIQDSMQEQVLVEGNEREISFQQGKIRLKHGDAALVEFKSDNGIALLDARKLSYPLLLRKWKPGDYFYPLGMKKKKKLARFFIDNKISMSEKEKIWVIEMDKKILWVVGMRIDDRFKITDSTKEVLQINYDRKVENQY